MEETKALAIIPVEPINVDHAMYVGSAASHVLPAPFLTVENVQAMATGFLKMQAGSVSVVAPLDSLDDEYTSLSLVDC